MLIIIIKYLLIFSAIIVGIKITIWLLKKFEVIREWWDKTSVLKRIWYIGALAIIFVHLFDSYTYQIRGLDDFAFDTMNEIYADTDFVYNDSSRKYTFIDIDNETFMQWGEPLHVPRDKLQSILHNVLSRSPEVVVVDLDLTFDGVDKNKDKFFINYINNLSREQKKVIFMRSILTNASRDKYPDIKKTFFEPFVTIDSFYWSLPIYLIDESDAVIRRWKLATPICIDKKPSVMFAPHLIVANIVSDQQYSLQGDEIQHQPKPMSCASATVNFNNIDERSMPNEKALNLKTTVNQIQRIFYSYSYNPDPNSFGYPQLGYSRISARLIDQIKNNNKNSERDFIKGSIVVIGASYSSARDMHRTPIGDMPGALIILNSIKSMLQYGNMPRANIYYSVIISTIVVWLIYLFVKYHSTFTSWIENRYKYDTSSDLYLTCVFIIKYFTLFGVAVLLILLSFNLLKYGIWSYAIAPIVIASTITTLLNYPNVSK